MTFSIRKPNKKIRTKKYYYDQQGRGHLYTLFYALLLLLGCNRSGAQVGFSTDSIQHYQENYRKTLEVVGNEDRRFITFFPIDSSFHVQANVTRLKDDIGFDLPTSSGTKKHYFKYARLTFSLNQIPQTLFVYKAKALMNDPKYKDYLFVPFGDATSGQESYGGGRYLDLLVSDLENRPFYLDFNKAYNPYCAYTTGYNCPIPPSENLLKVPVTAGEKNFGKPFH